MTTPSRRAVIAGSAAALGLSACAEGRTAPAGEPTASSTASPTAPPLSTQHAAPLLLTQTAEEARQSLDTIEALDSHPMWEMDWYGTGAEIDPDPPADLGVTSALGFGCTLWVATGTKGRPIVGRNWDWEHGPGLVLRSSTEQARTLTLTDMAFLGLGTEDRLDELGEEAQGRLLRSQAGQVEGMNEHGVFMGLAADSAALVPLVEGRPFVGGLSVQRLVLDQARTVAEALEIIQSVNLDFTGGPGLHYLLADRHGDAAVLECDNAEYYVEERPADQPWFCLENFHMASVDEAGRQQQRRWSTCAQRLGEADGVVDVEAAMDLLDEVRQGITQWSTVYDLAGGTAELRTSVDRHSLALPE